MLPDGRSDVVRAPAVLGVSSGLSGIDATLHAYTIKEPVGYAHARNVLGEVYPPEAVYTQSGIWRPALCYIASEMVERPADPAYVARLLQDAENIRAISDGR